ncbi:MAG: hypothetical protein P8126_00110 [Gammaproteobacteria bacterium]|jgi:hypothetical protein
MPKTPGILLLSLLVLGLPGAHAQDQPRDKQAAQSGQSDGGAQKQQQAQQAPKKQAGGKGNPGSIKDFKPSEKISNDLSVSFPVDI